MNGHKIMLNDEFALDLSRLIDTRLLIQSNSGGGKSWLIRRLLEQSNSKVQQIVIDLEGEFSTLREKYDYILAGKDGDTPADPKSAALLARRLLELNVSAIVDLYELSHQDRKRFVKLFLNAMMNAPKSLWHPCLVIIDEAHVFAPQTGQSEAMEAVIDLATRGRKRGFCAVLATQRISKMHKDAAAEMNNKLIGRTGLDIDRKRAAEELGFTSKEESLALRNLAPGRFFAFGPAISEVVTEVQVGAVATSHPKAGDRILTHATPPTAKVKALLGKLADLPQEAQEEAHNIEDLRRDNVALRAEILRLKKEVRVETVVKLQKEVIADPRHLQALKSITKIAQDVLSESPKTSSQVEALPKAVTVTTVLPSEQQDLPSSTKRITGGAMRMLQVLASRHPMRFTKSQLALFSKMSPKSGTYGTYLSLLRSQGMVDFDDAGIGLTLTGIKYMGDIVGAAPQSQNDILDMWRSNLTGGVRRIFEVVVSRYPEAIHKEELGEATDMSWKSGTFGTYLSQLRRNGLIESNGNAITASKNLFIVGE